MHDQTGPQWLTPLLSLIEECGAETTKVESELNGRSLPNRQTLSRWLKSKHGITLNAYLRMRRLSLELGTVWMHANTDARVSPKSRFEKLIHQKAPNLAKQSAELSLLVNRIVTPLGPMVVAANDTGIVLLEFADRRMLETQLIRVKRIYKCQFRVGVNSVMQQLAREMTEYFEGIRTCFNVSMSDSGSEFQNSVWDQLKQIPTGTTSTYKILAKQIRKPRAVRAVGKANGDNRLTILIPCHRVIGSDGSLTGYGGGLDRKMWLLNHEAHMKEAIN